MPSIELLINLIFSFYLMVGSSLSLFERKKVVLFPLLFPKALKYDEQKQLIDFKSSYSFLPSFKTPDRMNSARSQAETKKAARAEPGKTHKALRPQGPSQLGYLRTAFSPEIYGIGRAMMLSLSLRNVRIW